MWPMLKVPSKAINDSKHLTPYLSKSKVIKNNFHQIAPGNVSTCDPTRLEEHGRRSFEAILERSIRQGVMGHARWEKAW